MDILIVKPKWAELILTGQKTWEIRGSNTRKRGLIGIAESGTGKVYGEVELIDSRAMFYADFVEGAYNHKLSIVWGKLQDIYPQPYIRLRRISLILPPPFPRLQYRGGCGIGGAYCRPR